jgi:hypothetical protein
MTSRETCVRAIYKISSRFTSLVTLWGYCPDHKGEIPDGQTRERLSTEAMVWDVDPDASTMEGNFLEALAGL